MNDEIENEKILNSYKNKRQEIIHYTKYVFSGDFINVKQLETFVELVDSLIDDSDRLYKIIRSPESIKKRKEKLRKFQPLDTDIFEELDENYEQDKKMNEIDKIVSKNRISYELLGINPPPEEEEEIIETEENNEEEVKEDEDTEIEEVEQPKDDFEKFKEEDFEEVENDEDENMSSLEYKTPEDIEEEEQEKIRKEAEIQKKRNKK